MSATWRDTLAWLAGLVLFGAGVLIGVTTGHF
jgi:hypothetical protein